MGFELKELSCPASVKDGTVELKVVRVLAHAWALHAGWEGDNDLWACEMSDGSVRVVWSGSLASREELLEQIELTARSLRELTRVGELAGLLPAPEGG